MIEGSCHCGKVQWKLQAIPESATACNCTACRRYGVLWAYDYEDEGIHVSGSTKAYVRGNSLGFHFCPECGCVAYWRSLEPNQEGRRQITVNLRLTEPGPIAHLPIDHFDGLEKWEDLPQRRPMYPGYVVLSGARRVVRCGWRKHWSRLPGTIRIPAWRL